MSGIIPQKKHSYKDNYIQFGTMTCINMAKLEKNILLMKYKKSLGPINNMRGQQKISDELRNFLLDLIDTQRINVDSQKALSLQDIELFEKILSVSKMKTFLNYKKYTPSISDYVSRLKLLRGALNAGNHSKELRDEIIDLLRLLSSPLVNIINLTDANEFIDMLSDK